MPYRRGAAIEVLIAHPGGPLWAKKDAGHWTIVKGEVIPGEDPRAAAAREFQEETSWTVPDGDWLDLGSVRLKSGKTVLGMGRGSRPRSGGSKSGAVLDDLARATAGVPRNRPGGLVQPGRSSTAA